MNQALIGDVLIIFGCAIPVLLLFGRWRIPSVIGLIATGAVIGPHALGLISAKQDISILAELGVAFLLFTAGLDFSFSHFEQKRLRIIIAGLLQMAITLLASLAFGQWVGWTMALSFYFGAIIALSSTAVVLTVLHQRALIDSIQGRLAIGILILQDLALVPMMIGVERMNGGQTTEQLLYEMGLAIFVIILVIGTGRLLLNRLVHVIATSTSRELFVMATLLSAVGSAWVTHKLGLSFALGAFLAGLFIGQTEYRYQATSEIAPFRHVFNSLFLISIGMLLDTRILLTHPLWIVILIIAVPLIKSIIATIACLISGFPLRISLKTGTYLGQIGEFSFLLAFIGYKSGVIPSFLYDITIAIAVFSLILTPLMIATADPVSRGINRLWRRIKPRRDNDSDASFAEDPLNQHVIICGYGPSGQAVGQLLAKAGIPIVVLELNPASFPTIRHDTPHILFGDGASDTILLRAHILTARAIVITIPDFSNSAAIIRTARRLNPSIHIISRTRYHNQTSNLQAAGANVVIAEEVEGGLAIGEQLLQAMGRNSVDIGALRSTVQEKGSISAI